MCEDRATHEAVSNLKTRLERLEKIIYEGEGGRGGIAERLASLEKQVNSQSKLLWTILTATIGTLVKIYLT